MPAHPNEPSLVSSEIGNLWMTYQEKTMILRFIEYFLAHVTDDTFHSILEDLYAQSQQAVETITLIMEKEKAAIPVGFKPHDVNEGTPRLWDELYDPMFLHMMSKIEINLFAMYVTMSYRQDIRQLYQQLTIQSQHIFDRLSTFLLEKGVLVKPPMVTMPKEVNFVHELDYLSGYHLFGESRSLNTIEVSLIHHAIETNLIGMQLMIGFAQVANNNKVREYFIKGMKLSKDVETSLGEFLRQDYIEPPATHAGKATHSKIAPFSDKMMMYLTSLLATFGLGSNALGSAFSLRSDLPVTMTRLASKILSFVKEGGEIMIQNGWMEEPPQIEDRRQLTKA
ncbi:DUF3231 family protein [Marinicrinis sediminis]|uniref:DUF3231 family protein n=1 Tax=Marinicrinis sediminis TaxID=1652465 RepID=A0ABW5RA35_9BACL